MIACDLCGEPIEPGEDVYVLLDQAVRSGSIIRRWERTSHRCGDIGVFHGSHERDCFAHIASAIARATAMGSAPQTLATIPTASSQRISALRRKHMKGDQ